MKEKNSENALAAPETFDGLRQRIRDRFPTLSPHLQRIARSSLEEPNSFALNTTQVIANQLEIQPSTLIRFAKEFGYKGFSEFQRVFRQRLIEGQAGVRGQVLEDSANLPPPDAKALLDASVAAHVEALGNLAESCDLDDLATAIRMMRSARHVYIAGLRRSRPIAEYLHYGLLRAERACSMLDFSGGMAGPQIATISREDLLVAIAFPPYSVPVVEVVMDANVVGRRILTITDSAESPLARHAELALFIGSESKSRLQPISAAIALVQTLVTATGEDYLG
jgi:DNA-binding MurR/RpiR family transcriptional regulator